MGSRGSGRGERTWHPQSAYCVASNFINTFIILCHTASGTSGACTPLPCPTPHSPPLPVQTAISLPQRALWLVIWRLISGLTWQRLLPVLMLFNIVLQLLSLPPLLPPLPTSERINKNYCIYLLFCMSFCCCCCFSYCSSSLLLLLQRVPLSFIIVLFLPPVSLLSPLYSIYNVDASDMHT